MKSCFLFGHRDCPDDILPEIEKAIERFYTTHRVRSFYVGNRGRFDALAATALRRVKLRHPDIGLYLLLAYHPGERATAVPERFDNTFYPPLETVPRPFAIVRANQYMVDATDSIICYVRHFGNTRNLFEYAQRRQKRISVLIENLAETCQH